MDEDVAGWKLAAAYLVWLLASAAIALVGGLLVGAIAGFFGVEFRSTSHQNVVAVVAVISFVVLAILPFLLKDRMSRSNSEVTD